MHHQPTKKFVQSGPVDKRRTFGKPGLNQMPEFTSRDMHNLRTLKSLGAATLSDFRLDDPIRNDAKTTFLMLLSGREDLELNAIMGEAGEALLSFFDNLKEKEPRLAKWLELRLDGLNKKKIGEVLGFSRERSRQFEQMAIAHMLMDPVLRRIIEDVMPNQYQDLQETALVIDHLRAMGVTDPVIVKWAEQPGFPGYLSIRLAMPVLCELYYPLCMKTNGDALHPDRLDSSKFSLFFRYSLVFGLKGICRSFESSLKDVTASSIKDFTDEVRNFAISNLPKDIERFFKKEGKYVQFK